MAIRLSKSDAAKLGIKAPARHKPEPSVHSLGMQAFWMPGWHPARLNSLLGKHWGGRSAAKKADYEQIGRAAVVYGLRPATGPRRVDLFILLAPGQRAADPDAYWKSLLDALVRRGLLMNDSRRWCVLGKVEYARSTEHGRFGTMVILEDMET